MNVLYLTHTIAWKGGGIFYTAFHQGRFLAKRGHEVILACISPTSRIAIKEYFRDGVKILEFPDALWGRARSGWDLWDGILRIIKFAGKKIDIIHCFESRPVVSVPGIILSKLKGIPLVFTWADWFGRGGKGESRGKGISIITAPIETLFEDLIYPKADLLIAMGKPLADRASLLGIPKGKIKILLHGCDTDRIRLIEKCDARRLIGNITQEELVIGYLGVLQQGNAELLFQGFKKIIESAKKRCRLILIGNTKLDWRKYSPPECRLQTEETGWIHYEKVNQYLSACDILILPLKKTVATDNVWPSKINDYFAVGRPIVATRMKVLESIFNSREIGILCRDSPNEIAEACVKILNDSKSIQTMSNNARVLAETDLSWNSIVDKLEGLYITILSR